MQCHGRFKDPAFIELADQNWAMTSFVEVPKKGGSIDI